MNLKLMGTLFFGIFSFSTSFGLTCNDAILSLPFSSATIQDTAVMCRYSGFNKDGTHAANAYYINGKYEPMEGNWGMTNRNQWACRSEIGNASDCQFKLKN